MRQRITLIHSPEDAIDPDTIAISDEFFALSGLQAAREDRITFGFDELPTEVSLTLRQSHELHVRYVNRISYKSISPLLARLSPGLHVYYSPQRGRTNSDLLCPLLHKIFSLKTSNLCGSPEKSFTSLPTQRFQHSTAYEYYLPKSHYNEYALVDYILQACPSSDEECRRRAEHLRDAEYIDFDFDTISHALTITPFWTSQTWDIFIPQRSAKDRIEIGILSNEKPIEVEELNLGGFLTVLGEDHKPSPTLFAFPARHHEHHASFYASFLKPTGLHPNLQLQISDAKPPSPGQVCSLHAHLTLPRVIFPDKYQLSDKLFMASKNLSTIRHVTSPVDLEAPEYAMSIWGSTLLLELAPPTSSSLKPVPWTAEIPLHLRYLPPTESGFQKVHIPWPVLFWACIAEEGTKFTINPFDRVNLGYDGLFGPRTMFYHLSPGPQGKHEKLVFEDGMDGYSTIEVPVMKLDYSEWVELGTTAAILLGFTFVMWKIWLVWWREGYGRVVDVKDIKKKQ